MYKLVALDIDGTILDDKEQLTKENIDAIHSSIKKGVPVCLCTGRNIHNTKRVYEQLKIETPYVCIDGAVLYDRKNNKYIKNDRLNKNILLEILDIVDKEHLYVELCTKHNYVKYIKTPDLAKYIYSGVPNTIQKKYTDYFVRGARFVKTKDKAIKWLNEEVHQLIFAGEKEIADKVKETILSKNYEGIEVKDDLWEGYVFISLKNCRKIDGVKALCDYYGIDLSEAITVGDQMNDFDMIKGAGLGVAMGNAHEKILDIADYVTFDNNNSGVANVINKFVLGN